MVCNRYKIPYFFNEVPWVQVFSLLAFVRLLFEGGVYFFCKPMDINNG